MAIKVTHSGKTYTCETAIKCTNDKYIKLFDANGIEIVSFDNISDFGEYTISGGKFTDPAACTKPIKLTTYVIGGRTILVSDWKEEIGTYVYEIEHELFTENRTTCDILLCFGDDYDFDYYARQYNGKIKLTTFQKPQEDIVIESIQITKA